MHYQITRLLYDNKENNEDTYSNFTKILINVLV